MKLLDLTLPTPAENLALDEALLDAAESFSEPLECLRLWETTSPAVIIGRSSHAHDEVDLDYCRHEFIPVLRRCSGGAAVLIGPGCFMYSLVLSYDLRPQLRLVDQAHCFVLTRVIQALQRVGVDARFQGTSDLTLGERKISGNSMRCKHRSLLYHGTILRDLSALEIERCLKIPPRQPPYRQGRSHSDFVGSVPLSIEDLRSAFASEWEASESLVEWPRAATRQLVAERYGRDDWTYRL